MKTVGWDKVLPIAEEAFHIWVDHPELQWAEQAWAQVQKAGLAADGSSIDRLRAYVRFLVLASMYRDWCALVWDEVEDDSPEMWLSNMEVNPVQVGQLLGQDVEVADDSEEALPEALHILIERERAGVVRAVLQGFGGDVGLFLSLWRSQGTRNEAGFVEKDDEQQDMSETHYEILNEPTREKLAGYEWISEGCQSRGPIRSTSEMDDHLG